MGEGQMLSWFGLLGVSLAFLGSTDADTIVMRQHQPAAAAAAAVVQPADEGATSYNVLCYYTNWSQYRPDMAKFTPENIDVSLCTHLVFAFAKIDNGILATVEWNDEAMYKQFNDLKAQKPGLKTLLSVGGWNLGSAPFSQVVASAESRKRFIDAAVTFLRTRDFDGLDVDWEWPTQRGSGPEDKDRFTQFIKELAAAFTADCAATHMDRLMLTVTASQGKDVIDAAFDVPNLVKYVDYLNVVGYDFHGPWDSCTGITSPLYARSTETGSQRYLNVDWAIRYWISKGAPASKLNLGIASYGHTFTLANPESHGICAPVNGPGDPGPYTRTAGFLAYFEVCSNLRRVWTSVYDDEQKSNYAFVGNQWIGYDDPKTVKIKADYIKNMTLAGAFFWSLDLDDFEEDFCQNGSYPLLKTLAQALRQQ